MTVARGLRDNSHDVLPVFQTGRRTQTRFSKFLKFSKLSFYVAFKWTNPFSVVLIYALIQSWVVASQIVIHQVPDFTKQMKTVLFACTFNYLLKIGLPQSLMMKCGMD